MTTWGNGNYTLGAFESHDKNHVTSTRAFIQAVLDYTGASKVDVIAHSMGVTLTRRVLKGGVVNGVEGAYNVGDPLTSKIDTFLSLAGGNYGIYTCKGHKSDKCCNDIDGYWPAKPYEDGPS